MRNFSLAFVPEKGIKFNNLSRRYLELGVRKILANVSKGRGFLCSHFDLSANVILEAEKKNPSSSAVKFILVGLLRTVEEKFLLQISQEVI